MSSLLDSVSTLAPEILRSLGARLGEPADALQKGLQASVAAIVGTIAARTSDPSFMSRVSTLVGAFGGVNPSSPSGQITPVAMEAGTNFLDTILAGNRLATEIKVANTSGLQASSVSPVLCATSTLLLSVLGSKLLAGGLGLAGLAHLVSSELPALAGASSGAAQHALAGSKTGRTWLWQILVLGALLIGALIWQYNRNGGVARQAASAPADARGSVAGVLGDFSKRALPNSVELNIPLFGVENKLIDAIEDPAKPAGREKWFDFDRLLFDTGSAALLASSEEQLQNVAAILKAYPNVHLRIGGYTDNTGDASANTALAENRANNVMAELVKLGVDPSRLDAKGYGAEHPVADNSTEEGRAKNRRISLRVTQK